MTLAIVYSRASAGIHSPLVTVETHVSRGLPRFNIVGLPEAAVKESRDRVRSALLNTGFDFPSRRSTVNLAPADLPKEGGRFDLPIALGILAASRQIPENQLSEYEFSGELALSGELRPIRGIIPKVIAAKKAQRILIIPELNSQEASLVSAKVYSAANLLAVCAFLQGLDELPLCAQQPPQIKISHPDLSEVKGQQHAKRALTIAAAGKHNLLYLGSPGTGKTMLATRMLSILPELSEDEAIEIAALFSTTKNGFDVAQWKQTSFRAPHHSSSHVALVGGGRPPRPGEISLAHHGVLFLDEFPEFSRIALEALREPLESGQITISRASYQATYPAKFQLIAAMNPCPCGFLGNLRGNCRCTSEQISKYIGKLSGPLIDRIDMHVTVNLPTSDIIMQNTKTESSQCIKERVTAARSLQLARQKKCNKDLNLLELEKFCPLTNKTQKFLNTVVDKFNLSARVYHRIIKLSRTIADLEAAESIEVNHITESLSFRCLDRLNPLEFRY